MAYVAPKTELGTERAYAWDDAYWETVQLVEQRVGYAICGSKTGDGTPCQSRPIKTRARCKFHGGRVPRGVDSPHYRGKAWSKDLPTRLADKVRAGLENPDLISMREELALIDARMSELVERLVTNEDGDAWFEVSRIAARIRKVVDDQPGNWFDELEECLQELAACLNAHTSDVQTWSEIQQTLEQRRKIADTERKREEFEADAVTRNQWATFLTSVQTAIMEEVTDTHSRARLAARIATLAGGGNNNMLQEQVRGVTH